MLKWSLCYYCDAYTLKKGTISIDEAEADAAAKKLVVEKSKQVIFENFVPFTDCINKVNNKQDNNAKDLDVVIPMYNQIEYSKNYSRISGGVWVLIQVLFK